ncbi:hypothetical protein NPIL_415171 [Nephila pilipes]|uniref:Uncharacterized protein n=1 Tax=Nephila pilipes TaxID=299642 RepID=A0A8X6TVE5_NEPPI|nr:hypothetical protein NPIL_415171 [Nephila pilipes]
MEYFLKSKLLPAPHVKVPTAAFFTDLKAEVYAEQLTFADAASFKHINVSEFIRSPFEANNRPTQCSTQVISITCLTGLCAPSLHSPAPNVGPHRVSFHTNCRSPPTSKLPLEVRDSLRPLQCSNRYTRSPGLMSSRAEGASSVPCVRASLLAG